MRAPSLRLLSLSLSCAAVLTACPPPTTPPVAPTAPCMTHLLIASHESVGTHAPSPMTSEPLYDQSSLDALEARWVDEGLGSSQISDLRARLEQTQVIYASGSTFSVTDMKALQSAGFTDVEYSCPVAIPATVRYEVPPRAPVSVVWTPHPPSAGISKRSGRYKPPATFKTSCAPTAPAHRLKSPY
ncbi:MAG: hypothetical protein ACKO6N_15055 [Myxococcota bacterium]